MPEGPEVWILAHALRTRFSTAASSGKHVWVDGKEYTFGLFGGLRVDAEHRITHVQRGTVSGGVAEVVSIDIMNDVLELGPDWMTASEAAIAEAVALEVGRPKQLGAVLLDQTVLAGLGVAWASEVLHEAGLLPDVRASHQNLSKLTPALLAVRERIRAVYLAEWDAVVSGCTGDPLVAFTRGWFQNLYSARVMAVFKKGQAVNVAGRTFWKAAGGVSAAAAVAAPIP